MSDYQQFGQLLVDARESLGLSRTAVARKAGYVFSVYRDIEQGKKLATLKKFVELWVILEFDVDTLLGALPEQTVTPVAKRSFKRRSLRRDFGPYYAFGVRLIRARTQAELTIASVARGVGVKSLCIQQIEGGHRLPSLLLFVRLRLLLGFDASAMLGRVRLLRAGWNSPFARFGQLVQNARETLGKTVAEVADDAECDEAGYVSIERGFKLPTMTTLVHLHRVLRFDVNSALRSVWSSPRALKRLE